MRILGAVLMILGSLATAAALLAFAGLGMREVGVTLLAGVATPRTALIVGLVLLAAGALLRRGVPRG